VLITRLYLRNFRVFEAEVDLAFPPGLVGIYGANGAGKSSLLEAISFTLWGRARGAREEVRSAGVGADCVTEVEFEHEGHLYRVRRTLAGINSTMRAAAHCDGLAVAEGATDTRRYLHSVLGMDDAAFKASVFAEQKQVASFSSQSPAERRRLVLQLLGITPLDAARDAARRDARESTSQLEQLRGMLPDLVVLRVGAADAEAAAAAAETEAAEEQAARDAARRLLEDARLARERLDQRREAYDRLVVEGRAARRQLDGAVALRDALRAELADLEQLEAGVRLEEAAAAGAEEDRQALGAVRALLDAQRRLDDLPADPAPEQPDPEATAAAVAAASALGEARASATTRRDAAAAELRRALEDAERSEGLSKEAACPLCGQALGPAFAEVRSHRNAEVGRARRALAAAEEACVTATADAAAAAEQARRATAAERAARQRYERWASHSAARRLAETAAEEAARALLRLRPGVDTGRAGAEALRVHLEAEVARKSVAAERAARLGGRLERRPALLGQLGEATARSQEAEIAVGQLRARLRTLDFRPDELAAATSAAAEAERRHLVLAGRAEQAALRAAAARSRAEGEAARLSDGVALHARLAELDSRVRHLGRVAVLLSEFRNTLVGTVGPRLAAQAAELFAELTDHDYDELRVDPDTYELQICDAGAVYGLDRFSGSEVDLANLALRVAISEHVRFQSGGAVGLLVLDEVFGPLDEERKARVLQALEQLRGRFRQIVVVTHDPSIKEQLPNALEVRKLPGRRATVHLVG